jgi:hypothetical protein
MNAWLKIAIALGALIAVGAIVLVFMIGPRNIIGMLRYDTRREGNLNVGDKAPDVVLATLDGGPDFHLLDLVGAKPLILNFGSYT